MIDPSPTLPLVIAAVGSGIAAILSSVAVVIGSLNKTELASVKRTGEATHVLSNSAMGQQLLVNIAALQALAVVLRRVAQSGDPSDLAAVESIDVRIAAAQAVYQRHVTQQAVVDATRGISDKY